MNTKHLSKKWDWSLMYVIGTGNKVPSLRDFGSGVCRYLYRRLKPAVNSVSSLRDFGRGADVLRTELSEEYQDDFSSKCTSYIRLYVFLSQIIPFVNPYLERLYLFLNNLQNKLVKPDSEDLAQGILDHIDMDSYRLQRIREQSKNTIITNNSGIYLQGRCLSSCKAISIYIIMLTINFLSV